MDVTDDITANLVEVSEKSNNQLNNNSADNDKNLTQDELNEIKEKIKETLTTNKTRKQLRENNLNEYKKLEYSKLIYS